MGPYAAEWNVVFEVQITAGWSEDRYRSMIVVPRGIVIRKTEIIPICRIFGISDWVSSPALNLWNAVLSLRPVDE
jgi:hypothetical protein